MAGFFNINERTVDRFEQCLARGTPLEDGRAFPRFYALHNPNTASSLEYLFELFEQITFSWREPN